MEVDESLLPEMDDLDLDECDEDDPDCNLANPESDLTYECTGCVCREA